MKRSSFFLGLGLFALVSFVPQATNCRRSGISGHVYFVSGNQMPSPDHAPSPPKGLKTILYIYELTNISQVTRSNDAALYRSISAKAVKEIETDEDGSFKVKLKPGRYSLFVKKGELFYSNLFDSENNIHPVDVFKGRMTAEEFKVDYDAVY